MTTRTVHPRLSVRQLNRATLARQLLLERADLDVVTATERIGGLQAQEPASPHIGLWTRLARFEPADLDRALAERTVVKGTLMRATLHIVSAADYLRLWPAIVPLLGTPRRQDRLRPPDPQRMARLTSRAEAFTAEPRSLGELRDHLGSSDGLTPDEVLWWIRRRVAFAHAPSEVPWSFGRRPRLAHALTWLDAAAWPPTYEALESLARRYLAAFGPASAADLAQWSGLAVGTVRPGIEAVEAAGDLRRLSDERGRELLDLEGAPLPDADTPAPPRLLPMWDSTILAFADRTRLISDEDRRVVVARNGDTLPTFTVDGVVAGLWWAEAAAGGLTRIIIEPFRPPLRRADAQALEEEGERLAALVAPLEPAVYSRYRRWRPAGRVVSSTR
jgi:hypothetical protein